MITLEFNSGRARKHTMNKIVIIVPIVILAAIAVGVMSIASGPDLDKIIQDKDCAAALSLTDADMEKATSEQQIKIGLMMTPCILTG